MQEKSGLFELLWYWADDDRGDNDDESEEGKGRGCLSPYGAELMRITCEWVLLNVFCWVSMLQVTEIDYSGDKTIVKTASGESYAADKVFVAF